MNKLNNNHAVDEFNRFATHYESLMSKMSALLASFNEVIEASDKLFIKVSAFLSLFNNVMVVSEELERIANSPSNKRFSISSDFKTRVLHTTLDTAYNQLRRVFSTSQLKFSNFSIAQSEIKKSFDSSKTRFTSNKELVLNSIVNQRDQMFS